jgi:hypothetical protein
MVELKMITSTNGWKTISKQLTPMNSQGMGGIRPSNGSHSW